MAGVQETVTPLLVTEFVAVEEQAVVRPISTDAERAMNDRGWERMFSG